MANVRVKINSAAARRLLNSPEIQSVLLEHAQRIQGAANSMLGASEDGFTADVRAGKNRAHALVKTGGAESRRHNSRHNTLLKAFNGG